PSGSKMQISALFYASHAVPACSGLSRWQQDEKVEAKSSVSKKILDWRYGILFFLKDYSANSIPQEDFGG
ncbi:MAG: hypothetical protein K1V80_09060, partial [Muribaculaceae bacterium]